MTHMYDIARNNETSKHFELRYLTFTRRIVFYRRDQIELPARGTWVPYL